MEGQKPYERLDIYHCKNGGSEKCGAPKLHGPDHIPAEKGGVCDLVGKTMAFVCQTTSQMYRI